jgi:hypothetical protein
MGVQDFVHRLKNDLYSAECTIIQVCLPVLVVPFPPTLEAMPHVAAHCRTFPKPSCLLWATVSSSIPADGVILFSRKVLFVRTGGPDQQIKDLDLDAKTLFEHQYLRKSELRSQKIWLW